MARRQKITQYRERLDRTLASPKLTEEGSLKSLVENQIRHASGKDSRGCGEKVIEKRTAEVANFLDMLRSCSESNNDRSKAHDTALQREWKVKQENEEYRVMYREGPEGSPFHTLLVEGYVDGPLDICLCISWESALYSKWWPQSMIPSFKILSSQILQSVRNGEQISLVRAKVSWPLSTREAIIHYFLFEYFEDDLLVVLLNTVSDSGSIDVSTDGFTSEAIPEAKDVVRIGVVGGFALQKVTPDRSYFRTIATMDVKLDFVPPSLINFMSRQLIGSGFRLYQKAVSSRFTADEEFSKALKGSLYARIREALSSSNKSSGYLEEQKEPATKESDNSVENEEAGGILDTDVPEEEDETSNNINGLMLADQKVDSDIRKVESRREGITSCEIEEIKSEESKRFDFNFDVVRLAEKPTEKLPGSGKRNINISSEVEQALGTLEKVISMVRQYGFNSQTPKRSDAEKDSKSLQEAIRSNSFIGNSRQDGLSSFSKEVNHNRIAPASPEQKLAVPKETADTEIRNVNHAAENHNSKRETNGFRESKKEKRHRFCCFGMAR